MFDVASYILASAGEMTAMKLQKLVYYAQAWSLVWLEKPLFEERIEAWSGGPVVPVLYQRHRGQFKVDHTMFSDGDPDRLNPEDQAAIRTVIEFYGKHTAQWLSDLTHLEQPWINARERAHAAPGDACHEEITQADMAEYYGGLTTNEAAQTIP